VRTKPVYNFFCFCGALLLLLSSCGSAGKNISEGEIEYEASAVDPNNPMAMVAPGKMFMKFKKDKFAAEMSTMGVFVTTFIADPKTKTLTQMVKVFEDKRACIETESEIAQELEDYKLTFEYIKDSTKLIAGYKCKLAIATKVNDPTQKFDVWYTEEIDVKSPNFSNPYGEIKGMLMEYRLEKFGLEMSFKATSVTEEKVPDETFVLPGYYKIITCKEMKDFFDSIQ
jgi:GLPGLI family protein